MRNCIGFSQIRSHMQFYDTDYAWSALTDGLASFTLSEACVVFHERETTEK